MKNTLILHGWGACSESNFFPWLKNKIMFEMDDVFIPNLPNTSFPILSEQLDYISLYSNDFKNGGSIIGHSLGGQLSLHFAIENNIKNTNFILVGPSYNGIISDTGEEIFGDSIEVIKRYFDEKIDFEKFNKLNNKVTIFLSDNDPFIDIVSVKKFYGNIDNIDFKIVKNKGHFTIFELPEILDFIN